MKLWLQTTAINFAILIVTSVVVFTTTESVASRIGAVINWDVLRLTALSIVAAPLCALNIKW